MQTGSRQHPAAGRQQGRLGKHMQGHFLGALTAALTSRVHLSHHLDVRGPPSTLLFEYQRSGLAPHSETAAWRRKNESRTMEVDAAGLEGPPLK